MGDFVLDGSIWSHWHFWGLAQAYPIRYLNQLRKTRIEFQITIISGQLSKLLKENAFLRLAVKLSEYPSDFRALLVQFISVSGIIYEMLGHQEKFLLELADSSLIASRVLGDDRQWFVLNRVEE